jgi:hypothetical protein
MERLPGLRDPAPASPVASGGTHSSPSGSPDPMDPLDVICTICYQELNNPVYKVCRHQLIPVPTCLECYHEFNKVWEEKEASDDDICGWCGECEDLLLCGDENSDCSKGFCRNCIKENLGESVLKDIETRDIWTCLYCQPFPLLNLLSTRLTRGKERSVYKESLLANDTDDVLDIRLKDVTDEQIHKEIDILAACIGESNFATKRLDVKKCAETKDQITFELQGAKGVALQRSVLIEIDDALSFISYPADCSEVDEELQNYVDMWQRHYDIMMEQEADSEELLRELGLDIIELHRALELRSSEESQDEQFRRNEFEEKILRKQSRVQDPVVAEADVEAKDVPDTRAEHPDELRARSHPFIKEFLGRDEVPRSRYPPEFEDLLPRCLLKALYYFSDRRFAVFLIMPWV